MNNDQRAWLNAALRYGGSFVKSFAQACFNADEENFAVLAPALDQLMIKYPDYSTAVYQQ